MGWNVNPSANLHRFQSCTCRTVPAPTAQRWYPSPADLCERVSSPVSCSGNVESPYAQRTDVDIALTDWR